jgi:signal recognition particle subunit SRP19
MKEEMQGECILYPCYFDVSLTRNEGRRVPRSRTIKDPSLTEIEKALKRYHLRFRSEPKSHPAYWWKREGRTVVTWGEGKQKLISMVADFLEVKR